MTQSFTFKTYIQKCTLPLSDNTYCDVTIFDVDGMISNITSTTTVDPWSRGEATENIVYFAFWVGTPLKVWGSEFGIPNQYTGFKIALDTALWSSQKFRKN